VEDVVSSSLASPFFVLFKCHKLLPLGYLKQEKKGKEERNTYYEIDLRNIYIFSL